ncbi:MAG: hypothetical protein MJA30_05045 [Cytophagales bacterium]|nr:hypothetical protein [Cytophagales bacterium]
MAEWITVISLVVLGLIFVLIELLFIPGTTVVGILGFVSTVVGIYLSFDYFGGGTGWWFTLGSTLFFAISFYFSFKSRTWERFSLKSSMQGKVNEGLTVGLKVEDEGFAVSTLKPVGKAEFNDKEYEVRSFGSYIEAGTKIKIVKIEMNNILVEPIQ